MAFIFFLET